jgi:hypothetical protein
VILELIRTAEKEEATPGAIAAGPLEDLVKDHTATCIDRFEAEAARDPGFRRSLAGVRSREEYRSPDLAERLRRLGVVVLGPRRSRGGPGDR